MARRREQGRKELEKAKRGFGLVSEAYPPTFSIKEERIRKPNEKEVTGYMYKMAFKEILPLIKDERVIRNAAEDVRSCAVEGQSDPSSAWYATTGAAALKELAQYYEEEGKKLRREEEAKEAMEMGRKPKKLPPIPTIRGF